MKQFKFRLETVLRLREKEEEQKKKVVGELMTEINEYQQQALEMSDAIERQGQILKEHIQGSVDVKWVARYQGFVTAMRHGINEKVQKVTEVQQKLAVARNELAEAAKQRKIIEKLKEKEKKRFDDQLKKIEMREMDEIGTQSYLWARGQN